MSAEQEETINPEYQGTGANTGSRSSGKKSGPRKPTGFAKFFWIIVAIFSGLWWVLPETEFLGPIDMFTGGIDDGVAAMVLLYALSRLGIRIPFLEKVTGVRPPGSDESEKPEKPVN
ncbi:MAG: hypothetical protein KDK34_11085 [Leptospiraceae bacterium]|nr:hypothetical protein [Leptospiraceae bacterium]